MTERRITFQNLRATARDNTIMERFSFQREKL
jgi:hypothetical protein